MVHIIYISKGFTKENLFLSSFWYHMGVESRNWHKEFTSNLSLMISAERNWHYHIRLFILFTCNFETLDSVNKQSRSQRVQAIGTLEILPKITDVNAKVIKDTSSIDPLHSWLMIDQTGHRSTESTYITNQEEKQKREKDFCLPASVVGSYNTLVLLNETVVEVLGKVTFSKGAVETLFLFKFCQKTLTENTFHKFECWSKEISDITQQEDKRNE